MGGSNPGTINMKIGSKYTFVFSHIDLMFERKIGKSVCTIVDDKKNCAELMM